MATTRAANALGAAQRQVAISIASEDDARDAIGTMDAAIKAVNSRRTTFGATSTRLDAISNSLTTGIVNLSDARSRIEDVDYAAETAALAKAQILAQASMAMLAQANQSQQLILQLLR